MFSHLYSTVFQTICLIIIIIIIIIIFINCNYVIVRFIIHKIQTKILLRYGAKTAMTITSPF